jgi:hypothetical protein
MQQLQDFRVPAPNTCLYLLCSKVLSVYFRTSAMQLLEDSHSPGPSFLPLSSFFHHFVRLMLQLCLLTSGARTSEALGQ